METKTDNCQQCGSCCWRTTVFATEKEIGLIARMTGKKPEEFSSLEDDDLFKLKYRDTGYCIFLQEKEKFCCSIYEFRPDVCKSFPSDPEEIELCPNTK
ncbi:MAG: YkgJ family cysteine cluster protein [Nanoarchaeota archaeon]|nr:YkgJ family cysteine cluster protein [Nanoarchaeota archaeon]